MNSAIIVAGGKGSRIESTLPKQYITLGNKEILNYSVTTFLNNPHINEVIIVCKSNWKNHVNLLYPNCKIVNSGKRRQDSVFQGLLSIDKKSKNVLIHDAARPFITSSIISNCISALKTFKAVAPIIKLNNSIIKFNDNNASYIDRELLRSVQTPQCFHKQFILDIFKSDMESSDEIGMVLNLYPKTKIKFLKGDINNFKITTNLDLKLAKELIKSNLNHA